MKISDSKEVNSLRARSLTGIDSERVILECTGQDKSNSIRLKVLSAKYI